MPSIQGAEFEVPKALRWKGRGGPPPQPTRGSEGASNSPPGTGEEPRSTTFLAHFEFKSPFGDKKCAIFMILSHIKLP